MDKATVIGIVLGVLAIGIGLVLKGVSLLALFNPAAILIIFVGTAASVLIAFPTDSIKKIPLLIKIIFKEDTTYEKREYVDMFSTWANKTRREGILSLEAEINDVEDPFLASGLQFAIDGQSPDFIRDVMIEKIEAMEERHREGISIFRQAGTYAPTLGVLGAVVGLIAALGNMEDMTVLGEAISAAFMATLFGIFSGYVLWHPFANKLNEKSQREVQIRYLMIEGILSITIGESPQTLRDKLNSYLSKNELVHADQEVVHEQTEEAIE